MRINNGTFIIADLDPTTTLNEQGIETQPGPTTTGRAERGEQTSDDTAVDVGAGSHGQDDGEFSVDGNERARGARKYFTHDLINNRIDITQHDNCALIESQNCTYLAKHLEDAYQRDANVRMYQETCLPADKLSMFKPLFAAKNGMLC